jgi:hypothetical protein
MCQDGRLVPGGKPRDLPWTVIPPVAHANQLATRHGLTAERIPADPDGPIVLSRFRTSAWHIARLPGGRIALATQYGHPRASAVTDGAVRTGPPGPAPGPGHRNRPLDNLRKELDKRRSSAVTTLPSRR